MTESIISHFRHCEESAVVRRRRNEAIFTVSGVKI